MSNLSMLNTLSWSQFSQILSISVCNCWNKGQGYCFTYNLLGPVPLVPITDATSSKKLSWSSNRIEMSYYSLEPSSHILDNLNDRIICICV